jgi:hypothetical protein
MGHSYQNYIGKVCNKFEYVHKDYKTYSASIFKVIYDENTQVI